jgi:hypothetical protein
MFAIEALIFEDGIFAKWLAATAPPRAADVMRQAERVARFRKTYL